MQEVAIDLVVKIFTVGHHQKGKVAAKLTYNLPCKEHHRETLTRTLRVPEHAHLAFVFLLHLWTHHIFEPLNGIVHTKKLMVLCTDFITFVVHDEVLHIVKEFLLIE